MRSGTAVARLRAFAAVPEMVAIRTALPYSFVGLVLGIATFIALQPSGEFLSKFYRAFAPAFGIRPAKRRDVPPAAALPIACAVFLLSLPYRHASSPLALLRALGTSGLFLAIVVAIAVVALLAVSRARLGSAAGTFVGATLRI